MFMILLTCLSRSFINRKDLTITSQYAEAFYISIDKKSPTISALYMPFFLLQRIGFVAIAVYMPHRPTG
jgi:hypothetical protein